MISAQGIKADVILNDIANVRSTQPVLMPRRLRPLFLSVTCACCESLEELSNLCKTVSEGDGDLLFIELNGTADPLVLMRIF